MQSSREQEGHRRLQARGACPKTLKTAEPQDTVQARDCHWLQPLCWKQKQGENSSPGLAEKIKPSPGCRTESPSKASFADGVPKKVAGGGLSPGWNSKRAGAVPTSHLQGPRKTQCCSPSTNPGQGSPLGRLLSVGTWEGGCEVRAGAGRGRQGAGWAAGKSSPVLLPRAYSSQPSSSTRRVMRLFQATGRMRT